WVFAGEDDREPGDDRCDLGDDAVDVGDDQPGDRDDVSEEGGQAVPAFERGVHLVADGVHALSQVEVSGIAPAGKRTPADARAPYFTGRRSVQWGLWLALRLGRWPDDAHDHSNSRRPEAGRRQVRLRPLEGEARGARPAGGPERADGNLPPAGAGEGP